MANKTFNNVQLYTKFNMASTMQNIVGDGTENLQTAMGKIAKWYDYTNGFTSATVNKVSTTSDGIVSQLPSSTGGFLKNTGTAGGTWATIGISDLPRTSNAERVLTNYGERFMKSVFEPAVDGDGTEIDPGDTASGKAQLGSSSYRWSRIYGVNLYATKLNDVTIPNNPVFTDHIATATTTGAGAGKAVTSISDDGAGNITATTDSFLLSTTTYAGSDTVGGSASKAKSLNVHDVYSASDQIIDTAIFEVGARVNSTTHDDSFAIMFADTNEAVTGSARSYLLIDNENQGLVLQTTKNDGTWIFSKRFLTEDDIPSTSDFIPVSGSTAITGNLVLSTNKSSDIGSSTKAWKNVYAGNLCGSDIYTTSGSSGNITIHGTFLPDNSGRDLGASSKMWGVLWCYQSNMSYINSTDNNPIKSKIDIAPETTDTKSLGTSSLYWKNLYASTVNVGKATGIKFINSGTTGGSLTSNATTDITWTLPSTGGTISLDGHTHSYIPLSGSSSITGSLIPSVTESYDLGSSDKIWNYTYTNYLVAYSSIKHCVPSSDGWTRGIKYSDYTDSSSLGRIGAYGSGSTLSYYFIGDSYSDTSHLVRVDNDGAGKMTLVGTLPQLKFRQTTSGSAYNNDNAGIKCHAANQNGMNMAIQSGGNMIIGSGEFPTNIYNRSVNDSNFSIQYGSSSYKPTDTSENTWIGSDGNIYLFANAGNIGTTENTSHHYWQFNMNGRTWLPKGKDLNWTNSNGYIATMVPGSNTTDITLTLPSSSGTLSLDGHTHSYIPLSGSSSITGNLVPSGSRNLGSSSSKWNNLYVNNINGESVVNGNAIHGSRTYSSTNSYNEEIISKVQLPKGCAYSSGTTLGWHLIATITREGSSNTNYNIGGTLLCQSGNNMIASPGLLYINSRVGATSGTVSAQYLRWIRPMFKMSQTTSRVETDIKYCAIAWNNKKCTDPTVGDLSSSTYDSTGDITTQIWVKLPAQYISHSCTLIDQIMPPGSNSTTDYVRWHFPSNVVRNDSSWSNFYTSSNFGDPANPSSASSSTIVGKAYAASDNATNIYLARYVDEQVTGYPETPMLVTQLIDLTTLSWTRSGQGLYYSSEVTISTTISSTSYNCAKVYAVHITNFGNLKATDNVNVISNSNVNKIRVTASTNSFYSSGTNHANITVAVYGLFYK